MSYLKKLILWINQLLQFKVKLGGKLSLEHFVTSIVFTAVSAIIFLVANWAFLFFICPIFALPFTIFFGPGSDSSYISFGVCVKTIRLLLLTIPTFLLIRLMLILKKEGVLAFLAALVGGLLALIPFLLLLFIGKILWSTF